MNNNRLIPGRIASDMISFCKASAFNTWNTMSLLHEQAGKTFITMMEMPLNAEREFLKMWQEASANNKKMMDDFGRMWEHNFDRAQEFFAPRNDASASDA